MATTAKKLSSKTKNTSDKGAKEILTDIFKEFGQALGEIFDDPKLKANAKEFTKTAGDSLRSFGSRFKDKEVQAKFKKVSTSAKKLGKNISDFVKEKTKK